MKFRRFIALLSAVLMIVVVVLPVNAAAGPEPDSIQEVCTECGDSFTIYVCSGAPGLVATVDCSTAGCTVRHYKRSTSEFCGGCNRIIRYLGRHDCYQIHSSCGKGTVKRCSLTVRMTRITMRT